MTECAQCDREISHHRAVTLKLEYDPRSHGASTHTFCSDSCKTDWLTETVTRFGRFLNQIYIRHRGKAHDLAHVALHTNEAP